MTLFSTLRQNSRLALRDSWGRAILILLIPAVLGAALSILLWLATTALLNPLFQTPTMEQAPVLTPDVLAAFYPKMVLLGVFSLLSCLVQAPLQLGACRWFRALVHGKSLPVGTLFHFFESFSAFRRSVWFTVNRGVRCILWAVPFFSIPAALGLISVWHLSQGGERAAMMLSTMGLCLAALLLALASLLYIIHMNRYILAAYLLCEDDGLGVGEALRISAAYTRGYRLSFFVFGLTFLGWILLSVLTLGLGAIYTAPYLYTAYAMYGRYIIEKNRYIPPNATREFVVESES